MNNSKFAIEYNALTEEEAVDQKPMFRQRETDLVEIIEALRHIRASNYWKVLEAKVFTKEFNSLQKQLRNEKNPTEIYRLQGRITQAEKFDLEKELQAREMELRRIREQINAN